MSFRGTSKTVTAALALTALLATTGCAAEGQAAPTAIATSTPVEEGLVSGAALADAEQRLSTTLYLMGMDQPDIGAVARDLVTARELEAGTIELIGVEDGETDGGGFGTVQLRVLPRGTAVSAAEEDPPVCFSVRFNRHRDIGSTQIACPADAQRIEPPANTSTVLVVPVDAQAVALEVLGALAETPPSAQEIAAAIDAGVTPPSGELEQAYPADVVVEGDDVGVAFGRNDDCELIARIDGVTQPRSVPSIQLQEGELGCFGRTAITTPPSTH